MEKKAEKKMSAQMIGLAACLEKARQGVVNAYGVPLLPHSSRAAEIVSRLKQKNETRHLTFTVKYEGDRTSLHAWPWTVEMFELERRDVHNLSSLERQLESGNVMFPSFLKIQALAEAYDELLGEIRSLETSIKDIKAELSHKPFFHPRMFGW